MLRLAESSRGGIVDLYVHVYEVAYSKWAPAMYLGVNQYCGPM